MIVKKGNKKKNVPVRYKPIRRKIQRLVSFDRYKLNFNERVILETELFKHNLKKKDYYAWEQVKKASFENLVLLVYHKGQNDISVQFNNGVIVKGAECFLSFYPIHEILYKKIL